MKSTKCCQRSKRKTPDPAENRGADSMVRWLGMWSEQRYHRQGDSFGKIIQVYLFAKGLWKSISGNGALIKDRETHAKRRKWNAHTHIHTYTHTHTHTHIHTHTYTHIYTHTHTYTHTRLPIHETHLKTPV